MKIKHIFQHSLKQLSKETDKIVYKFLKSDTYLLRKKIQDKDLVFTTN